MMLLVLRAGKVGIRVVVGLRWAGVLAKILTNDKCFTSARDDILRM